MNYFPYFNQERQTDVYVQGEEAAKAYLVAPNGFVRLWDSTTNRFYEKRGDQTGRPYMDTFEYTKISAPAPVVTGFNTQEGNYIAKELDALKSRLDALEKGLKNEPIPESDADATAV